MLRVSEEGNHRREGYLANYKQIHNSLTVLQNAADQIFDTISGRTANESAKLVDLSSRIQRAKARVEAISHSKQVIRMKSSSRYPTKSDGEEDFQSLFGYRDGATDTSFPVTELLVNGGLNREFGVDGTFELFQFFSDTTGDFVQKEAQPKVGSKFTHQKGNAYIENLLAPPNNTYSSFLKEDNNAEDSLLHPTHQRLPPPPPSLLQNSQALPRSEDFSLKPVFKSSKIQNNIPDLPNVLHMVPSDPGGSSSANLSTVLDKECKVYLICLTWLNEPLTLEGRNAYSSAPRGPKVEELDELDELDLLSNLSDKNCDNKASEG
ncbi:WASH1 [Macleaya cordata]|uniref:WASH1 n=1 Tax=Macleaya cordata TaxID=56857 RepID=A0A200Q081_MACCD|nr:WASH1 [Macleaya cordata]